MATQDEVHSDLMDTRGIFAASHHIRPVETRSIFEKRSLASNVTFGGYSELEPGELEERALKSVWQRTTHRHVGRDYTFYEAVRGMPLGYQAIQKLSDYQGEWVFLEDIKNNGRLLATSRTVEPVVTPFWCAITETITFEDRDEEVLVVILAGMPTRLPKAREVTKGANRWAPTDEAKKLGITHVILDRSLPEDE